MMSWRCDAMASLALDIIMCHRMKGAPGHPRQGIEGLTSYDDVRI